MHDIPRKDREDADDVDEDEVSEVSGGLSWADPDGTVPILPPDYPQFPIGVTDPDPAEPADPYLD